MMTYEEKLKIYEEMRLHFRIEDARTHITDLAEKGESSVLNLTDSDIRQIAEIFIDNYDCNVAENDQWDSIIRNFADDKTL